MPQTRSAQKAEAAKSSQNTATEEKKTGRKRDAEGVPEKSLETEPPAKKPKAEGLSVKQEKETEKSDKTNWTRQTGTIERGHIYFFYRPRVQVEEVESEDDVKNLHLLLVPRPPAFAASSANIPEKSDEDEMQVLSEGADAVPADAPPGKKSKGKLHYRLITVGKKHLPDPEKGGRKDTFWASVTAVGDDLHDVEEGLGEQTYDTKTRGTRHNAPARLAARGAYALVNNEPPVPSKAATHLGYRLSHPSESDRGAIHDELSIYQSSSFVVQVKNPHAPAQGRGVGLPEGKRANYPDEVYDVVFGRGVKGRESYGLRFTSCNVPALLDYKGAELLLIADKSGKEGLEQSLGEGRGEALAEAEDAESRESTEKVMDELVLAHDAFPAQPLKGEWI